MKNYNDDDYIDSFDENKEFIEEQFTQEIRKTKATYEEIQNYLKTNIQGFLHNLSTLPKLKILDLSNNKIHFFDIDPFHIQQSNGFRSLVNLDISNNVINEELGIILVMNLPAVEALYFDGNPLLKNKKVFENIEYEIFRSKNILFYDNTNVSNKRSHTLSNRGQTFKGTHSFLKPLKVSFAESNKLLAKKYKFPSAFEIGSNKSPLNKEENKILPEFNIAAPFWHINNNEDMVENLPIKSEKSGFFLTNDPNLNKEGSRIIKVTSLFM